MSATYRFDALRLTPAGAALTLAEHSRATGQTRAAMAQALYLRQRAGCLSPEPRADLLRDGFTAGEIVAWYESACAVAEAAAPRLLEVA